MNNVCEKCGTEITDNEKICPNCKNQTQSLNNKRKKIVIAASIVAVVTIVLAIIINVLGNSWKKPIDKLMKGIEKGNTELIMEAFPDFITEQDELEQEMLDTGILKINDKLVDKYGDNLKISYKVSSKEKMKKDDLEKVEELIKKVADKEVKISDGYSVKLKLTIKGKDDSDTQNGKYYVYKIDGKWCLLTFSPAQAKEYLNKN